MTRSIPATADHRPARANASTMNWWLGNSRTLDRTLLIIKHMHEEFDLSNISTAMYQLAMLARGSAARRSAVVRRHEFSDLLAVAEARIGEFEPGHLSNTLWSLAKLDHRPGEWMLRRCFVAALRRLKDFKPKNACKMLWASAKLGHDPGAQALEQLSERAASRPEDLGARELSDALWSFAKLGHHPGTEALDRLSASVLSKRDDFRPRMLSGVLWSFAKLGHHPGAEVLDRLSVKVLSDPADLRPRQLSGMLWALAVLATLGDAPDESMLRKLAALLDGCRPRLSPEEMCQVFHAHILLQLQPAGSPLADQPGFLEDARSVWTAGVAAATQNRTPSALERKVAASLVRLGEPYRREQLTEDACFSIDFALSGAETKVALEVDGPSHHLAMPGGGRRLDGPTLIRNRCLEFRGWRVVSVHHRELGRTGADIDALIAAKLNAVRNPSDSASSRSRFGLCLRRFLGTFGAVVRAGWEKILRIHPCLSV